MTDPILAQVVQQRFQQSMDVPTRFFEANADLVSWACLAMARRFHRGGRLLVFGNGGCATDAQHVAVEFVHPVIVGKRALPAIALTNDIAAFTGIIQQHGVTGAFTQQLQVLARPQDIAMGLSIDGNDYSVLAGLHLAREMNLLTLGLAGTRGGEMADADLDFFFVVPSDDPMVVQETHETLYHILWELVHVFFEHRGLLEKVSPRFSGWGPRVAIRPY